MSASNLLTEEPNAFAKPKVADDNEPVRAFNLLVDVVKTQFVPGFNARERSTRDIHESFVIKVRVGDQMCLHDPKWLTAWMIPLS